MKTIEKRAKIMIRGMFILAIIPLGITILVIITYDYIEPIIRTAILYGCAGCGIGQLFVWVLSWPLFSAILFKKNE